MVYPVAARKRTKFSPLTDEIIGQTQEGRNIYRNEDGSQSSERSITMEIDGQHYNFPSMYGGKELSDDDAFDLIMANDFTDPETGRKILPYPTSDEAEAAAGARSEGIRPASTVNEIENAPIPRRQMEQMSRQAPAPGPQPERPFYRQEMDMEYELPPALAGTDLQKEAQQYDTLNPLRVTQGVIENLMSMGSMFAGSVPGFMKGVWEATRGLGNEDDSKAAGERYVDNFLETQEFFTYEPRSVKGKKYRDALMHLFETWGEWGKKNISDPAFEAGYPNIAAWAQTSIEALPILLPLKGQVPFRGKGAKPTPPVMRPKPAETPVDAKMTFEMEAPAPEVPRGTIDLPQKADPMKPKPVGERSMADLEPLEPLEGIKPPDLPELSGKARPPAGYEEAPRPAREQFIEEEGLKEGLRPEEVIEPEKAEFGQEYDKLYPPEKGVPISKEEMDLAYEQVGEKQGPSPDVTVYHGSGQKFEKFDPKMKGTGEGAAAYGEGLYLAENKGVAQTYADTIGGKGRKILPATSKALSSMDDLGFTYQTEAMRAIRSHPDWKQRWDVDPVRDKKAIEAIEKQLALEGPEPTLYKATIPGEMIDRMLDYDKPPDSQPLHIREAFNKFYENKFNRKISDMEFNGRNEAHLKTEFQNWARGDGPKKIGVPGIKYWDQGSRGGFAGAGGGYVTPPKQTRNYVLFDQAAATIREINEQAVPEHLDPLRTPPETPIKARKPTKPWKAKGLDVQKDSMFDAIAKMGGLKRTEAENFLGLDPGQKLPTTVFGRPIFRKKGKAVDEMADELANEGYLERDPVTGKVDPREFEEKFGEEAMGRKQYSRHKEYDDALFADEYQKYLEEQYKEKGDKGTTFNTGIPIEEIKTFTKRAWQKVKDALAIREPGVTVEGKPRPKAGPFLSGARSPSQIAKKIDGLELPFKWSKEAESLNFRYKKMFNERRRVVRKILKRDGFFQYSKNKKTLHGLLMESDFLGKEFTKNEIRSMGHSENIVKAYGLTRSLYNTFWRLGKKHLKAFKQPVPEYMKGYVPHYFHDWFIRDADTGSILGSAKNLQQAVAAANEMKRGGKAENIDIYPKPREFEGQEIQAAIIGDARYLQMQKKLEARFKMTPQEAQQLLGSVFKKSGKTKIFENFLERKGVSGWVKDLDYVENRYFNMLARYLAQDRFKKQSMDYFERKFGEFDKDWRGDARYVKNFINDVLGHPTAVEEMLNKFIKNAPGFRKITENYLGDRPAHTIANNTTSVISALKLGLYNLSAAGVNLTQLNNVYAILGERAFLNGVTRAAKAQKDIAAKNWNIEMVKSPNSDLWVLKELGIDQQQGYAATEGFMPGNFVRASLYAFTKAEFINRSVAALGGFHKFMRENKHLPLKERRLKALEYAEEVNYRSNFNYGVEDAQSYLRQSGPPGKVAFQFKKFVGKQFEFMTTLKGAENPRFWIPYLMIAGYQGIPGIQSLIDLAEYFTGTDMEYEMKNALMEWVEQDDDLDRDLKQAIADDVMYGAFSLAKANAASRIGLGDALTGGNIGGPAVTTVVDTIQALANENYAEAIRKFATSPGNLLKALDSKTLRDPRRRNRKIVELEPWDRVLKGIGFRTMKETIESDKSRIIGYMERKIKKEETEAITGYWNAVEDKDKEEMDKQLKKLEELGVDWKRVRDEKIKRDFMTQSQRKLETVPRKRMLDYLDTFRYGQERKNKAQ